MKLDKEFVMKNRFWVMLGLAMPLSLIAILMMFTAVSSDIQAKQEKLKKLNISLAPPKIPWPNQDWIDKKKEEAAKTIGRESEVWLKGFLPQEGISTWAAKFEADYHYKNGLFAYEIVVDKEKKLAQPEGAKDEDNIVYGTVKYADEKYIEVTRPKKDPLIFRLTGDIKVMDPANKKLAFAHINPGDQVKVTFEKAKYFNDRLTDDESRDFAKSYHDQIEDILKQVDPLTVEGKGVVMLRDWLVRKKENGDMELPPRTAKFFQYVPAWNATIDPTTISQEAWIAQEDLWIQREIYRMVRLANDYVSKFRGNGGAGKKEYTFTNPYWEVRIGWNGKKPDITLKNLLNRRQKVGMTLLVKLHKTLPAEEVVIKAGEPLEPSGFPLSERKITDINDFQLEPQGVFEVEQILTWETAAVKRIDQVSIGALATDECSLSHRTFGQDLKAFPSRKDELLKEGGGDPAPPVPPGDPGRGFPGQGAMKKSLPNGLVAERYLEVTKQARRLPVGVVLIVDQGHSDRVLTAFANSKLRFWINQILLNRYPNSIRPLLPNLEEGLPPDPVPFPKGGERKGFRGFQPPPPGPGYGQGMAAAPATDDQESNVELVLYGTVTLYERFPHTKRRDALLARKKKRRRRRLREQLDKGVGWVESSRPTASHETSAAVGLEDSTHPT